MDIIRVDLTPEEADALLDGAIVTAVFQGLGPTVEWSAVAKILRAQSNPLNGPTFPIEPVGVCVPGGIDPRVGPDDEDEIPPTEIPF